MPCMGYVCVCVCVRERERERERESICVRAFLLRTDGVGGSGGGCAAVVAETR